MAAYAGLKGGRDAALRTNKTRSAKRAASRVGNVPFNGQF